MGITSKSVLRLSFATASGETMSLTLPNPKVSLTKDQIEQVMDLVIAKDIFLAKGVALVSKKDIKIVDTTTNDLYDPQVV